MQGIAFACHPSGGVNPGWPKAAAPFSHDRLALFANLVLSLAFQP
jgi:hypothetical protein